MEFSRVITVALKIFLVNFLLYLLAVVFLLPLILSGNLSIVILIGFLLGLLGSAFTVYFILEEAEKISRETQGYIDTRRYDDQIKDLQRMIDEISKALPKETSARIEEIKTQCPKCGKKVPRGFKLCPHCGFDRRSTN